MSEPVLISVVIVSWNAKAYLEKCLETLFHSASSYPMEVLVVDNASTDGSPEMVAEKYSGVQLIQTGANLGFAKANNLGIRASKGNYLCLINSDVEVLKDAITRLVDYCEAHPEVGMAGPRIIGGDGKLQRSCRGFPTVWNMFCRALALDAVFPGSRFFGGYLLPHWGHDSERPVDILSGCFWLVRREALDAVGVLDESFFMYGEDMDWCKRFWAAKWPLAFVPGAEAIHYGGASSASAPIRFYIEKQRADLQYCLKHHTRAACMAFFLVSCLHLGLRIVGHLLAACFQTGARPDHQFKVRRNVACLKWLLLPQKSVTIHD